MAELQKAPWSDWETVSLIGRGSFGTVYEIQRKLVDDDTESAALKVITIPQNPGDVEEMYNEGYDDESITATFNSHLKSIVAEYRLMQKMDGSANVVNCKDIRYIQHDDGIGWDIYIRMELLTPLMKALPVDADEATVIRIGKDICNALVLCKKHEIVHRDIKPQNIFVSANGDYKLGDFGIAKTVEKTMGGTKIGTYKYMAPEVYNNQPYGSAADIYSLGLVLYWLLNERRLPFMPLPPAKLKAGQDEEARHRRLSGEKLPAPAHGSATLKQIVLKACAYDPKDRYTSAAAMLDDLIKLSGAGDTIPPIVVPREKPDEIQEDDLTTGPVFGDSHQEKTDVSENDASEATVGPIFRKGQSRKEDVQEDSDSSTLSDEKNAANWNKKIIFFKIASIVLGVVAIILIFLLLRSCGETTFDPTSNYTEPVVLVNGLSVKTKPNKTSYYVGETLDTSGLTLTATYSDGTTKTISNGIYCFPTTFGIEGVQRIIVTYGGKSTSFTVKVTANSDSTGNTYVPPAQPNWSDLTEKLPSYVTNEHYEIQTVTLYSTRTLETTSSTETNKMDGWELYDTVEADGGYGPWSSWTATKATASDTRQIETQTRYRYRTKETTTSTSSVKSGWTLYNTTYGWSNYGNWSSWSTSKPTASNACQVESKTQYSYRDKWITQEYSSWGSWSDWSDYSQSTNDLKKEETRTVYPYYCYVCSNCGAHMPYWSNGASYGYCYSDLGGCGRSDSITHGSWDVEYFTTSWDDAKWAVYNKHYIVVDGQKWYKYTDYSAKTQYRYATRTLNSITNYGSWSSYSDTMYSESSTREVKTRTVYRYRTRTEVPTYHFYRWGNWSNWSETRTTATNNRQVENTTYYRYCDQIKTTTYFFRRWTDWTAYSDNVATPSENVEVRTITRYRYKSKTT